jgi:hypothetical protein
MLFHIRLYTDLEVPMDDDENVKEMPLVCVTVFGKLFSLQAFEMKEVVLHFTKT